MQMAMASQGPRRTASDCSLGEDITLTTGGGPSRTAPTVMIFLDLWMKSRFIAQTTIHRCLVCII